jgi:hypothetical protein
MLSASVKTMEGLSGDTGDDFVGDRPDGDRHKVQNGRGTDAVWFDLLGTTFAVLGIRGLFAWSLTLLVAGPLILFLVTYLLIRNDKYYLFSGSVKVHDSIEDDAVRLAGWRGFFRFPLAIVISSALVFGSAFLIRKFNPFIVASSPYAV